MPYAQLDDLFPDHPKVVGLSDAAFRVHLSGIIHCARIMTDGFVLKRLPAGWHKKAKQAVAELEAAGLWEPVAEGWQIHDYLDWNRSRAEILTHREQTRRQRVDAGKSRAASAQRVAGRFAGNPAGGPGGDSAGTRGTSPKPIPNLRSLDLPADAGETGWKPTPNGWTDTQTALVRKLQEHDPGWEKLTPSALNKLSREFGKPLVTQALQHAWEDRVEAKEAYPLLAAICMSIKANS